MKKGNWMPIDKRLINLLPADRPYTVIEAMISYSVDQDNKKSGSINGYAVLWQWSRDRVRRFINAIRDGGDYITGDKPTGNKTPIKTLL